MKIENYDITKLTNDEKSDFEKIFNSIDNYINQKFNSCEYIIKIKELNLFEDLITKGRNESESDIYKHIAFLDDQLYYLKDELRNNYLNTYKKDDLKILYENILNDDEELSNEIYLYNKLYKNKKSHKNITDEFNEIGNFTLNNDDNSEKCKFENCNREATYRKLKVGNCHLKDTKYEYCSYHRPKNSINENFHINQYLIK